MLIDLSCPVENREISIHTNSETGEPYLLLKLLNISEKTITSLKFNVKAFDENGTEIVSTPVEFTELSASPKEFFAEDKAISISDISSAKNFSIEVTYATFENEEPYIPSEENTVDYDNSEASIDDALLLRKFVPNAVCFASKNEDHWKCACGRPNFLDSENCVRCGHSKDVMLANFSSKETLNNTLKLKEQEEELKALELENAQKEKKKKIKKVLITAGIVVVALALLTLAGFLVRYAVINFKASNAVKNNDYIKAYELYSKINSNKKADIIDKVMGNTPSNLAYATGFLAEDDENLYYITQDSSMLNLYAQPANLIKENKATKEKTILTDAAVCQLNVVGDYIYFLNTDAYPCRMAKDGKTTDILLETKTNYICVVGSDMYYIKTDYDNPDGFSEEECEILAAQGQIDTLTRLHKLNLVSMESSLVSTEEVKTCAIYGNRIYFLTPENTEDIWAMSNLKSMDMNGEDIKSIVELPVATFLVKDDTLFYVSLLNEKLKGSTITDISFFDYTLSKLDLKTGEKSAITSSEDGMLLDLNISGDKVVYITYNRDEFLNYHVLYIEDAPVPVGEIKVYDIKTGKTKSILTAEAAALNVCGNDVFCVLSSGEMIRLTLDGSAFEYVYEDGTNTSPYTTETEEQATDSE